MQCRRGVNTYWPDDFWGIAQLLAPSDLQNCPPFMSIAAPRLQWLER